MSCGVFIPTHALLFAFETLQDSKGPYCTYSSHKTLQKAHQNFSVLLIRALTAQASEDELTNHLKALTESVQGLGELTKSTPKRKATECKAKAKAKKSKK